MNVQFLCSIIALWHLKEILVMKKYELYIFLVLCNNLNQRHAVTQKNNKSFSVK